MPPSPIDSRTELRAGLLAALGAFAIWGVSPLYFNQIPADAMIILAHRILWSIPVLGFALAITGAYRDIVALRSAPKVFAVLFVTTILIAANWGVFIWAVKNGRILETSLGYYINPLMNVALGVLLLREPLSRRRTLALALAALGVAAQIAAVGALPWVSILLPILFALYGYLRKITPIGALAGLSVEVFLIAPVALVFLLTAPAAWIGGRPPDQAALWWLISSGPVTIAPLLLFNLSARRLRLTTIGALQFLAPSLSFVIGLSLGEDFNRLRLLSFALIWAGLFVYLLDTRRIAAGKPARPKTF